eukprot:5738779-Prymnesium_polylepis.1
MPDLSTLPEVSLDLHVPDGVPFVLYLCGGEPLGPARWLVTVDVKLGGYAHDVTVKAVQHKIQDLAARPGCLGVLSLPCHVGRGLSCATTPMQTPLAWSDACLTTC